MTYAALHEAFEELGRLRHAQAILTWDEAVMMPAGGGATRAEALATLAGIAHRQLVDERIGEWAEAAIADADLDEWRRANVSEMLRAWRRARALPESLVVESSRANALCEQAWRTARPANDWNAVAAPLAKVLALTRSTAQALAEALDMDAYDALLDSHEAGLSRAFVTPLFGRLKEALPSVIDRAIGRQHTIAAPPGPFPIPGQEALARRLMERVGFDFERGRLDSTHHPFCGGDPDDARVTTRYNEDNFLDSMFAVLHETGHAMYEQGLPAAWRGQPVGRSGGMALHESQSLFMEQQVCRGAAFFDFAAPLIREAFGADAEDARWSAANLHGAATRVERSRIRVEADETTYPLHVILRFELEQRLIDGALEVADIPAAWNAATKALLGFDLGGEHRDGCMQDVHWFGGIFGYFPTYTLGALAAAQLHRAAAQALPGLQDAIRRGEFGDLLAWLRRAVHGVGRLKDTQGIIEAATGAPLGVEAFLAHLDERYGGPADA